MLREDFTRERDACGAANRPMHFREDELEVVMDWEAEGGLGFLPSVDVPWVGWKRVRQMNALAFARRDLNLMQKRIAAVHDEGQRIASPVDVMDELSLGAYVAITSVLEFPVVEVSWFVKG